MQPSLIKVLVPGLLVELAWLYHVYHSGMGEAMVENEKIRDFNKEAVTDSFPLCGPCFE